MGDRKQQRQLLGYLLGALDEGEQERVQRRLARDPGLAADLARVEESLEPLRAVTRVHQPPPGLAARTCRRVFAYSQALAGRKGEPRALRRPVRERARAMSPAAVPPASTAAWGWSDVLVAAGVFLAIAGLLFPAIQRSRMNMRLVACQNNLRQLGVTQAQFHDAVPAALAHHAVASVGQAGSLPDSQIPRRAGGLPYGRIANPSYGSLAGEPVGRTERSDARRIGASFSAVPAVFNPPYATPHQGFRQAVGGRNLLFPDGHVTFVALGPIVDPNVEPSPPDDSFTSPLSSAGVDPLGGPTDFAPIVLVSRPGR